MIASHVQGTDIQHQDHVQLAPTLIVCSRIVHIAADRTCQHLQACWVNQTHLFAEVKRLVGYGTSNEAEEERKNNCQPLYVGLHWQGSPAATHANLYPQWPCVMQRSHAAAYVSYLCSVHV